MNDTLFSRRALGPARCAAFAVAALSLVAPAAARAQSTSADADALADGAAAAPVAIGDSVTRSEIARTFDQSAGETARRVVGTSVVDGRFVNARGLGERYTNAQIDGSPLPSPDAERNALPLDTFPSLVLQRLTLARQFTPDAPGDFAGGSLRIRTRDFPERPVFQIALSGGLDTDSTFRKRPSYYGSSTDWLGYDSGRRAFPPGIPERRLDQADTTTAEQVGYGYRFNTLMSTMRKATPPNHGITVVAGNTYKLDADKRLGAMVALSYGHSYELRDVVARNFTLGNVGDRSGTLLAGDDFAGKQGVDTVRWGLFGSASLELERHHTLSVLALRSQSATDSTSELQGQFQGSDSTYHTSHLEYVARTLDLLQLRGEHHYPQLHELQIDWRVSIAHAGREQPDTRDVSYLQTERRGNPGWLFSPDGDSGQHSFFNQTERTLSGGVDVTQPLIQADRETKLKFGALLTSRDRAFRARRFQFVPAEQTGGLYNNAAFCYGAAWSTGCPSQLFRPDLVRGDGLLLDERTGDSDQYESGLDVYALYGMIDTKLFPQLRAIAGLRPEITYQSFRAFDPFDRSATAAASQTFQTDWLPALSLIYALGKQANARFGANQTVIRPQLREIAPALLTSYSGDSVVRGSPGLAITKVTNLDLRFEDLPTFHELLAVGLFYKRFQRPIEEVMGGSGTLSFANTHAADAVGVELEGRKTLDVLAPQLKLFTLIGDLTLVKSQVAVGYNSVNYTQRSRPLAYQSPYVVNLTLDYNNDQSKTEVRALYSVFGPRIVAAGVDGFPDVYELPRNQVDLSVAQEVAKHFELRLLAQNVFAAPVVFAHRDVAAFKQRTDADGTQAFVSLGNDPVLRRYNPGTIFTLTGAYTY